MPDQVPGHHRGVLGEPQELEGGPRGEGVAAGRDRPLHARVGQRGQQLARAGQRGDRPQLLAVLDRVRLLEPRDLVRRQGPAGLPQQRLHEQAAAHPDPPVNPPDRQVDADVSRALPATRSRAGRRCRSASRRGRTGRMALVPADIPPGNSCRAGGAASPGAARVSHGAMSGDGAEIVVLATPRPCVNHSGGPPHDDHHPSPARPGRLPVDLAAGHRLPAVPVVPAAG